MAAVNKQISIQKDSRPSEFSRPLTSFTLIERKFECDRLLSAAAASVCLSSLLTILKQQIAPLKHCLLLFADFGQALLIRSCHEDVILTRRSHNWAGTAFLQGDSAGGSKLIEQTLRTISLTISLGLFAASSSLYYGNHMLGHYLYR